MKRVLFSFAALAALLATTSTARADLQIAFSDGTDSATYTATGAGTYASPGPGVGAALSYSSTGGNEGVVVYNGTPGSQSLNVVGGTLNVNHGSGANAVIGTLAYATTMDNSNSPGVSGHAFLNSSTTTLTYTGTGIENLTLTFSGNGFQASNFGTGQIAATEVLTNLNSDATVSSIDYINPYTSPATGLNLPAGTALPPLSAVPASGTSATVYLPTSTLGGGTFALGQVVTVSLAGGQSVSFQASTSVTPEPATLAAWGCGLGLIGLVRRRRRAAQTA